MAEHAQSKTTLIAAVLHELVKAESFDTLADVAEALKCRCAKLKIPYDGDGIYGAITFVQRTRPVLTSDVRPHPRRDEQPAEQPITRANAVAILAGIRARLGMQPTIRTVKPAKWTDQERDARERDEARIRAKEMGIDL